MTRGGPESGPDGTGGYLVHGHVKERDEVRNVMRTSLFLLNNFSVRIPLRASSRLL